LGRALVNAKQPYITVEALYAVIGDISCSAVNLHGTIRHASDHLRSVHLAAGRIRRNVETGILASRRLLDHAFGGVGFRPAVGNHRLDQLELDDGFAELPPLAGIAQAFLKQTPRRANAHRRHMQASAIKYFHRGLEPLPFLTAYDRIRRNAAVPEDNVACMRASLSHFSVHRPERKTWSTRFDKKRADAFRAGAFRIGPCKYGEQAGGRRVGDEALSAVDHVGIPVAPCGCP